MKVWHNLAETEIIFEALLKSHILYSAMTELRAAIYMHYFKGLVNSFWSSMRHTTPQEGIT